jgi:anaerobic selenocysteine-containing dehydrogenase
MAAVAQERLSYCRLCVAACGIVVTVDDDGRVVKVRGDADHPVSRGYVCPKGRGLAAWHESPRRLSWPRLRGVRTGWDAVLDDLAASLQRHLDAGDPSAIAMYQATGMGFDAAGASVSGAWFRSLRSRSMYTAVTVDNAPVLTAAELVAGNMRLNPMWSPERPGLLLLVGHNPVVSHGYGNALPDPVRHLREFRGRGGRIWVLDPRRTESAALADEHVPLRPGGDISVLAAVARALLDDGADADELAAHCRPEAVAALRASLARFTVARAAAAADVPQDSVERLIAEVRAHRGRLNVFVGTGPMMGGDGVVVEWLRWVLLILTGSLDVPGGMQFHDGLNPRLRPNPRDERPHAGPRSRPDLPQVARQMPVLGLVDEIEAGHVRALVLCGGDPLSAAPEPDRTRAALASLETLVVIDVNDNELCELATHVLPAAGQLERADMSGPFAPMALDSVVQHTEAVVPAGGERRPVWWILGQLARRMGTDLLGGRDPDEMTDDDYLRSMLTTSPVSADTLVAHGTRGTRVPVEVGWVRRDLLVDGCWDLAPSELVARLDRHEPPGPGLLLTTRRELRWINSVTYGGEGREPVVRMHPDDLAAAGVPDGGRAHVASAHGAVDVPAVADPGIRRGVVSMTHGRRGASPGSLVSRLVDVDPLTAMPRASALPVTVAPAPARG